MFGQEGSHYPLLRQTRGLAKAGAFWYTVTTQRGWNKIIDTGTSSKIIDTGFWGVESMIDCLEIKDLDVQKATVNVESRKVESQANG